MRKILLGTLLLLVFGPGAVFAGVNPDKAEWTIYKAYLYENADCTGTPVKVYENDSAAPSDFTSGPTIASKEIEKGTYNCVAIKMSDQITFSPGAGDAGAQCDEATDYTMNVCPAPGTVQSVPGTTTDADDGTTTNCTSGEDTVWLYLSTYSSTSSEDTFSAPASDGEAKGINLSSALSVTTDSTGTLKIDTTGTVGTYNTGAGGAAECGMDQPTFGFE